MTHILSFLGGVYVVFFGIGFWRHFEGEWGLVLIPAAAAVFFASILALLDLRAP